MRKLTLAIALAAGMAVVSSPALAVEFIIENGSDHRLDVGCTSLEWVPSGSESGVIDCSGGGGDIKIVVNSHGASSTHHAHDCPDPENPIHRILVTGSATDVSADRRPQMEFANSCEAGPE